MRPRNNVKNPRSGSLLAFIGVIYTNRSLLRDLIQRDFIGRYKGSFGGALWSVLNPLMLLGIYASVFSLAFKARWNQLEDNPLNFAIVLFSGMVVHGLFAECLGRAPNLINGHVSYVKRVVFPLELLPLVTLASASLHSSIGFVVLIAFCLVTGFPLHPGALFVPILLIPLILISLGFILTLSALGVYLRDLGQIMGIVTTGTLFLAPVFYPIETLPQAFQHFILFNPITLPITEIRKAMLFGQPIDWPNWCLSLLAGLIFAQLGYALFQSLRKGFADVL